MTFYTGPTCRTESSGCKLKWLKPGFIFQVVHVSRNKKWYINTLATERWKSQDVSLFSVDVCQNEPENTCTTELSINWIHIHLYSHFCTFFKNYHKIVRTENSNGNMWLFPLHVKLTVYSSAEIVLFRQAIGKHYFTIYTNVFQIYGHLLYTASLCTQIYVGASLKKRHGVNRKICVN